MLTTTDIQPNTFAAACYDQNNIEALIAALKSPAADATDCREWNISPTEWRAALWAALEAKISDLQD